MIVGLYSTVPQSGKSTVSQGFKLAGYRNLSLATPVKQSLRVVLVALGITNANDYLWGDKKDQIIPGLGVTGGYLMSTYATDFFREIHPDVWLNILKRAYIPGRIYVVDDMRFPNEFEWFKETGGYCIHIVREEATGRHGRSEKSEGQLDDFTFDYTIINNGTLEYLEEQTRSVIQDIREQNEDTRVVRRKWQERCGC